MTKKHKAWAVIRVKDGSFGWLREYKEVEGISLSPRVYKVVRCEVTYNFPISNKRE